MEEIPIFNPDLLTENIKAAGDKLVETIASEARNFVLNNRAEAEILGPDLVKAVLLTEALTMVELPPVGLGLSQQQLTEVETIMRKKDESFALISKAQRENSARIERLKSNAQSLAIKIGGVGAALLIRALLVEQGS